MTLCMNRRYSSLRSLTRFLLTFILSILMSAPSLRAYFIPESSRKMRLLGTPPHLLLIQVAAFRFFSRPIRRTGKD
jgi:hypothetical protein